jgi:putative heme iron utilization protein
MECKMNNRSLVLFVFLAGTAFAEPPPLCVNAEQNEAISSMVSGTVVGPVTSATVSGMLNVNEAQVVSTYGDSRAVGVPGDRFHEVWTSLNQWGEVMILITKGGNVFEVISTVRPGEPSKRTKYFNLIGEGAGLSGHLRPDLVSAIYGLLLPTKEGMVRGVMFFGEKGEAVFGVFMGAGGREPSAEQLGKFTATWNLLKSLPRVCRAS